MNIFQAIILGVVQGLTEFLPISSSGHLLVVPKAFGWDDPGAAFTAVIQLGTMAAILVAFRQDIVQVTVGWVRGFGRRDARDTPEWRLGWIIVAGTIPISLLGLAFRHTIEHEARNVALVAVALIVGGLIMEACDRVRRDDRKVEDARLRDGWLIGFAQALALIPGMSRSGSTISMARLIGFERSEAARVSFLLSIPAVVLSGLLELVGMDGSVDLLPVLVATLVSFVVGLASIKFLLSFLGSHRLTSFVVYRVVLGVVILVVLAVH